MFYIEESATAGTCAEGENGRKESVHQRDAETSAIPGSGFSLISD
jgi:hypothetical protein